MIPLIWKVHDTHNQRNADITTKVFQSNKIGAIFLLLYSNNPFSIFSFQNKRNASNSLDKSALSIPFGPPFTKDLDRVLTISVESTVQELSVVFGVDFEDLEDFIL